MLVGIFQGLHGAQWSRLLEIRHPKDLVRQNPLLHRFRWRLFIETLKYRGWSSLRLSDVSSSSTNLGLSSTRLSFIEQQEFQYSYPAAFAGLGWDTQLGDWRVDASSRFNSQGRSPSSWDELYILVRKKMNSFSPLIMKFFLLSDIILFSCQRDDFSGWRSLMVKISSTSQGDENPGSSIIPVVSQIEL